MPKSIDRLLEELSAATDDAKRANINNLASKLTQWFYPLDLDSRSANLIADLMGLQDHNQWYQQQAYNKSGGGSAVSYPLDPDTRLGAQIWILRQLAQGSLKPLKYTTDHYGVPRTGTVALNWIFDDLFRPAVRDLRRRLEDLRDAPATADAPSIPASDRIVRIDHNSAEYQAADAALAKVETTLRETNAEIDPEVREQAIAEVSAGRRLLQAIRVRAEAALVLLRQGLQWVGRQIAENIAGALITAALAAVGRLLGLW